MSLPQVPAADSTRMNAQAFVNDMLRFKRRVAMFAGVGGVILIAQTMAIVVLMMRPTNQFNIQTPPRDQNQRIGVFDEISTRKITLVDPKNLEAKLLTEITAGRLYIGGPGGYAGINAEEIRVRLEMLDRTGNGIAIQSSPKNGAQISLENKDSQLLMAAPSVFGEHSSRPSIMVNRTNGERDVYKHEPIEPANP